MFNIAEEELEATKPSATTTAYTSYMISQAQLGSVENAVAAVLACAWSYNWIGKKLAKTSDSLDHEFYGKWVQMYSSEEFTAMAENCIELINDVTKDKPEEELKRIEEIFVKTSYFEYMFWEMAEKESMWPVKELARETFQ